MHLDKSLFVSCNRMGPAIGSSNCNWVLKLILSCLVLSQNHAFLGYQNLMSCCFRTVEITTFLECQKHLSMQYNKLFKKSNFCPKSRFWQHEHFWYNKTARLLEEIIHQYKEFIVEHGKIWQINLCSNHPFKVLFGNFFPPGFSSKWPFFNLFMANFF